MAAVRREGILEAVFWDYDNTLVDTKKAHFDKHFFVLRELGIFLDDCHAQRVYENNGEQNWQWMNALWGMPIARQEYLDRVDAYFAKAHAAICLRSGVLEVLEFLQQAGVPQVIVTNGRQASVLPLLQEKKLLSFFLAVLCKEHYEGRKPSPIPYLTALSCLEKKLGRAFSPSCCLAIEDDPLGVESAHAAGLRVMHRPLPGEAPSAIAEYLCFPEEHFLSVIKNVFI